MNRKKVWGRLFVSGMCVALTCTTVQALTIDIDGDLDDWLSPLQVSTIYQYYDPDLQNPLFGDSWFNPPDASVGWWAEDGPNTGSFGYVGPGYGGQNYDVEAMYAYADDTGLYIAVVTGFDPGGVWSWNENPPQYRPGDLFLDFGDNGSWDVAIETAGLNVGLQPEAYGGTAGNAYKPTGDVDPWYTDPTDYDVGPAEIIHVWDPAASTDEGDPGDFAYSDKVPDAQDNLTEGTKPFASGNSDDYNPGDHNVIEVFLSSAWLEAQGYNVADDITVKSFWTEQCGNDWGAAPTVTVPQIPEPAGMVMLGALGTGMLAARRVRRKSRKR